MMHWMKPLFGADLFIPHGHCYLWKPELVGLHILSDALIALAYYSIPLTLFYFVRRRQDLPFTWVFLLFSAFIVACGTTHWMEIWTLWHPTYWLSGVLKLITAVVSLTTAVLLVPLVPKALALPSPAVLEAANQALQCEITDRKQVEAALQKSEARFQTLVKNMPGMIYRYFPREDAAGAFTYVSSGSYELLELESDQILQDANAVWNLLHPEDLLSLQAAIATAVQNRADWEWEGRLTTPSGQPKWIQGHSRPEHTPDGVVWDGLLMDITDRKQAELSLSRLAAIVESSGDAIIGKSLEGMITSWNRGAERLFGYTAAEVIDRPIALLFPPDHTEELAQVLGRIKHGETVESYETVRVRKDGQRLDIAATISPIKDATGQVIGAAKIARDITVRKQAEAALRESENRFQAFMNNSPAAAWITDVAGRMLYLSQTYFHLFPVPKDAVGKTIFELFAPDIAESFYHNIQQVVETNQTVEAIEVAPRLDGTLGEFLVYKFPIFELSGQYLVGGVAVDITEHEQAKRQLRSLNDRLQYLLIHAPVVIFSCKVEGDYGTTSMSENVRTLFGYEPQEFLADSGFWANHIHPEDRDRILANVSQIFTTGHHAHEYRFLHGNGEYRWVYNQLQLMRDAAGKPTEIIGYLVDISARKEAEKELQLQAVITQNMAEGICLVRATDGLFVYANPKFEQMFSYDPGELIDRHVSIVNYANEHISAEAVNQAIQAAVLQQGEATYEVQNVKKDGTTFWCQATTSLFEHPDYGTVLVAVQQDITERKQAEDFIKASLKEKEVLLKEVHHRVKNNLGVVDGLLQMQSRRSHSADVIEVLKESQNRIASIALVHEKLYNSDDLANIDFAQYIADLTAHLFASYNIHANQIKLTTQIDAISLDIDTAIPCGLIINELVSNALKYAFPNTQIGEIQVTLQQQQDQSLALIVRDNGIGLPQDFNLKQPKTLGMNLVAGLVKQLRGTLEINSEPGTTATIKFARDK